MTKGYLYTYQNITDKTQIITLDGDDKDIGFKQFELSKKPEWKLIRATMKTAIAENTTAPPPPATKEIKVTANKAGYKTATITGTTEIKTEYIILAAVGIVAVIMIIYFAFGRK
jgi:hypothetical protein